MSAVLSLERIHSILLDGFLPCSCLMRVVDVIARKRDGAALSDDEIRAVVAGATDGRIPDAQLAALLMAIVLRGMTPQETAVLTQAMADSGERLDLSDVPGTKVGKHSTGGVGDKVSIALVPVVAACGIVVPKMSGRGLGHTGGTIDKIESIPGYRTELTVAEFKTVLRRVGCSIIGQTASLVPADRRLYALRDVTATVESVPLIAASVMSKKLAEGTSALLLDVKCGAGAFMHDIESARALARAMVEIGAHAGVTTDAVVTAMDAPLGCAVGNAVEVAECVRLLRGEERGELEALVVMLGARMVSLGTGAPAGEARDTVIGAIESGEALHVMQRMIEAHGGDSRVVDDLTRLPGASSEMVVTAASAGYVRRVDAGLIGRAAAALGAGRNRAGDPVDHGSGVIVDARPGDAVQVGDVVLRLQANDRARFAAAEPLARAAVVIGEQPPAPAPLVIEDAGWNRWPRT
jgi:pyrimidine-nucleoside phosphorylase